MVEVSVLFFDHQRATTDASHSYRHMLECFVDRVKGRESRTWMSAEDSAANIEWINKVYEKVSLPDSINGCRLLNVIAVWTCQPTVIEFYSRRVREAKSPT